MFSKVAILFAVLAAANATALLGLASTGSSVTSRHQDAHGNYNFGYSVNDGHASSKSQSEVGTGGHKASAYNSHINHVAPVGYAAPAGIAGHGLLGAGALGYGAGIAGHGLLGAGALGYGAGIAGHGLLGAGPLGYGAGIAGHGLLGAGALGYGAGIAGHGLLAH